MATARNHQTQSIIIEPSNCRNLAAYGLISNDQRPHVTNSRLPAQVYGIYHGTGAQSDLMYKQQLTLMEIENAKLVQDNRQMSKAYQEMTQKYQQLLGNNSVGGATSQSHASCLSSRSTDNKLTEIQQQLTSLVDIYKTDRSQMQALVSAISKMEVHWDAMRVRLEKIEENSRGWMMDVHDYRDLPGGSEEHAEMLRSTTSPLYLRRDYNPGTENEIINSGSRNQTTAAVVDANSGAVNISETSGAVYSISLNGELTRGEGNSSCHDIPIESISASSITLDRRQSDSTTTNTIESGYCDDREDIFDTNNGDQGVNVASQHCTSNGMVNDSLHEDTESGESCSAFEETHNHANDSYPNRKSIGFINPVITSAQSQEDDGIEFVGRFITPKRVGGSGVLKSTVPQPSPSGEVRKDQKKQSPPKVIGSGRPRRPSVFSQLNKSSKSTALFMDFDDSPDDNETIEIVTTEPEISNLNCIFEDSGPEISSANDKSPADLNSTTFPSIKRKKDSINSGEQPKRIRGISKAPIKREPGSANIFPSGIPQQSKPRPATPPPPVNTSSARFMETLKNIKKERVAHAVDGYLEDEKIWQCICGHRTTTRNGIKLHVKHMGTEEARYMCTWPDCDGRFLYPYLVRNHLVKDHKDNTVPDRLFGCEKCYRVFYDQNNLKTHKNDRNEICKTTPRRRPHHVLTVSNDSVRRTTTVIPTGTETPKRPSIIVTL